MSTQTLNITLSSLAVGTAEAWWLNMKQLAGKVDSVTLAEAAELVDEVFDRDPCAQDEEDTPPPEVGEEDTPPIEEDEFLELAREFLAMSATCNTEDDGSYECDLQVARSHRSEPYKLVLDNGAIITTVKKSEVVTAVSVVQDAASSTMALPIISGLVGQWDGQVYDAHGPCTPPDLTVLGSTVNFGKLVTGSLRLRYNTEYDQVTVKINGPADGDPDPQPGECRVLAFYHDTVTELQIAPPELDEAAEEAAAVALCSGTGNFDGGPEDNVGCYDLVTYNTKCRCSGTIVSSRVEKVSVDCPEGRQTCPAPLEECEKLISSRTVDAAFVQCTGEDEGSVSDAGYYTDTCCEAPTRALPPCKTITSIFKGGKQPDAATRAMYPGATFVSVGPRDGVCGELTKTWRVAPRNCCDMIVPMTWDEDVSADVAPGMVAINGGSGLYTWKLHSEGTGFSFNSTVRQVIKVTTDPFIRVYTDGSDCGSAKITVEDGCTQLLRGMHSPNGSWVLKSAWAPVCQIQANPDAYAVFNCSFTSGNYSFPAGNPHTGLDGNLYWLGNDSGSVAGVSNTLIYGRSSCPCGFWAGYGDPTVSVQHPIYPVSIVALYSPGCVSCSTFTGTCPGVAATCPGHHTYWGLGSNIRIWRWEC